MIQNTTILEYISNKLSWVQFGIEEGIQKWLAPAHCISAPAFNTFWPMVFGQVNGHQMENNLSHFFQFHIFLVRNPVWKKLALGGTYDLSSKNQMPSWFFAEDKMEMNKAVGVVLTRFFQTIKSAWKPLCPLLIIEGGNSNQNLCSYPLPNLYETCLFVEIHCEANEQVTYFKTTTICCFCLRNNSSLQ